MYTHRVVNFAAPGKAPELRKVLEERNKQLQAAGVRAALHASLYSAEDANFYSNLQFDDLAALEAWRAGSVAVGSDATRTVMATLPSLSRQQPRTELYETLLAAAPFTPKFIERVTRTPLPGEGAELRELLLELAGILRTNGYNATVSVQVAGPAAGNLVIATLHTSLAALEKRRQEAAGFGGMRKVTRHAAKLVVGNPSWEISEVLIPFAPR